jgi:hypothetical protein
LGTRLASAAPLNNGVSAASILVSLMSAIEQRESGSYTLGGTKEIMVSGTKEIMVSKK